MQYSHRFDREIAEKRDHDSAWYASIFANWHWPYRRDSNTKFEQKVVNRLLRLLNRRATVSLYILAEDISMRLPGTSKASEQSVEAFVAKLCYMLVYWQ
jgi:hypothetical protein